MGMISDIKDIIMNEFQELEKHYKYEIWNYGNSVAHLEASLDEDENETDINNKYSEEDILNIKDVINEDKRKLKQYEDKLINCKRVLEYMEEKLKC
jgi:hypothetical protein